jgi:hypothetical protein
MAALRRLSNTLSLAMAYFGTLEALHDLTSDPQIEGRAQPFRLARLPYSSGCRHRHRRLPEMARRRAP